MGRHRLWGDAPVAWDLLARSRFLVQAGLASLTAKPTRRRTARTILPPESLVWQVERAALDERAGLDERSGRHEQAERCREQPHSDSRQRHGHLDPGTMNRGLDHTSSLTQQTKHGRY